MKVRALPTCKKPVGEGAKRTRGWADEDWANEDEWMDSGIEDGVTFDGTGKAKTSSSRRHNDLPRQRFESQRRRRRTVYLNPIVFGSLL